MALENAGFAAPEAAGLSRRGFLKVGAGFSLALACAGTVGTLLGCSLKEEAAAQGFAFLHDGDVELFRALSPAVVPDLGQGEAAGREAALEEVLRQIDAFCAALGAGNRQELRKLLDLLAVAPLRYLLCGVGSWDKADAGTLQGFLARWRASRFATLTAGSNALVKLVASSHYILARNRAASGYPGPLPGLFQAANS
jgi:hypothetical protein